MNLESVGSDKWRDSCKRMGNSREGEVAELVFAHRGRLALSTIHCFASRLYGLRKHMRKAATLVRGGGSGAAGPQDPAGTDT